MQLFCTQALIISCILSNTFKYVQHSMYIIRAIHTYVEASPNCTCVFDFDAIMWLTTLTLKNTC